MQANLASDAADKDSTVESQERNRTETVAGRSSAGNLFADGNASQGNPRLPVELLSRNSKIKSFVGAVAMFNFEMRVCVKVSEHNSFWKHKYNGEIFKERLNLNQIFFQDIGSREFFKPWIGERLENFIAASPAVAVEQNQKPENNEENIMTKKIKKEKKVKAEKAGGKISFVDELLLAGKHTKLEVAAQLSKKFDVPEKTAKNTVSWSASTMKKRIGKESKHLPTERASNSEKPAKKSAPKKKAAKKEVAPEVAAE